MSTATSTRRPRRGRPGGARRPEAGGTLVETVVAMGVLMIALLGLVASMAWGLTTSQKLRNMSDSKLTITSMLEQMETLRNTRRLTFGQLANQGQVDNIGASVSFAGFPTGFQPVSTGAGPDGIYGTGDDLTDAGPDNTFSTQDDFQNTALARPGYTRQIAITSLGTNLKKIEVTMRYPGRDGGQQQLVGISYLNNDANSNFR